VTLDQAEMERREEHLRVHGYPGTDTVLGWLREAHEEIRTLHNALAGALEEATSANAKMELLGQSTYTEDGIFSFPDGDYVTTKRGVDPALAEARERIRELDAESGARGEVIIAQREERDTLQKRLGEAWARVDEVEASRDNHLAAWVRTRGYQTKTEARAESLERQRDTLQKLISYLEGQR